MPGQARAPRAAVRPERRRAPDGRRRLADVVPPSARGAGGTPLINLVRPGFSRFCRAYWGLELSGLQNIPASGPLIITPNHQTYADPALVTIPVRRRVYYSACNRPFEIPVFSWMIRRLRAFPVRIDAADPMSMREAIRLLTAGHVLMIFPEGERTRTGRVERFKLG